MLACMTKEARWGEHVRAWRASGQTARAFAMSRGISDSSLRWWEKQLEKRSAASVPLSSPGARVSKPTTRSPSLARVVRPDEAVTDEDAGIALVVGEITIAVRRGFDRTLLRDVLYESCVPVDTAPHRALEDALHRVAELEAALSTTETLSTTSAALVTVTAERDKLRHAYEQVKGQLELLRRRRIFLAKAERIDTQQLEIEFAETKAKLDLLAKELGAGDLTEGASGNDNDNDASAGNDNGRPARTKKTSTGRRDIRLLDIPEERVEILDPALEGKAERIGFEESCLFGRRRGGTIRIVSSLRPRESPSTARCAGTRSTSAPRSAASSMRWSRRRWRRRSACRLTRPASRFSARGCSIASVRPARRGTSSSCSPTRTTYFFEYLFRG